jgi:hypothetical protein
MSAAATVGVGATGKAQAQASALPGYLFDHGGTSYRNREDTRREASVLLDRLELAPDDRRAAEHCPGLMRLLMRFALEVPLNITWYQRRLAQGLRIQRISVPVTIVAGVVALGLTGFLGANASPIDQKLNSTRVAVSVAVAFGVLQMVASALDYKARIGGFWRAMSDLKEVLFTFEETWRGKAVMQASGGVPVPEFVLAVYKELGLARKIAVDERTSYFATFRSPTDIIQAAASAVDVVRGKAQERTAAGKEWGAPADAVAAKLDDLRLALVSAKANKSAAEVKATELLKLVAEKKATEAQANEASIANANANAEVVRLEAMFQQLL